MIFAGFLLLCLWPCSCALHSDESSRDGGGCVLCRSLGRQDESQCFSPVKRVQEAEMLRSQRITCSKLGNTDASPVACPKWRPYTLTVVTLSSYFIIFLYSSLSMSQPVRSLLIVISGVLAYISATSQRERAWWRHWTIACETNCAARGAWKCLKHIETLHQDFDTSATEAGDLRCFERQTLCAIL